MTPTFASPEIGMQRQKDTLVTVAAKANICLTNLSNWHTLLGTFPFTGPPQARQECIRTGFIE